MSYFTPVCAQAQSFHTVNADSHRLIIGANFIKCPNIDDSLLSGVLNMPESAPIGAVVDVTISNVWDDFGKLVLTFTPNAGESIVSDYDTINCESAYNWASENDTEYAFVKYQKVNTNSWCQIQRDYNIKTAEN